MKESMPAVRWQGHLKPYSRLSVAAWLVHIAAIITYTSLFLRYCTLSTDREDCSDLNRHELRKHVYFHVFAYRLTVCV